MVVDHGWQYWGTIDAVNRLSTGLLVWFFIAVVDPVNHVVDRMVDPVNHIVLSWLRPSHLAPAAALRRSYQCAALTPCVENALIEQSRGAAPSHAM